MKYQLTDDLLTGNSAIDTQHKELIDIINDLMDACAKGEGRPKITETLNFLEGYVAKHFTDEEKLQEDSAYPAIATHKAFHEKYKTELTLLANRLKTEGATIKILADTNLMVSRLITHIRIEDKKVAIHLQ